MKPAIALLVGLVLNGAASGAELTGLKVLYVGSERPSEFLEFLKGKVATVEARSRESFGGSLTKTSRPAPAISPATSASCRTGRDAIPGLFNGGRARPRSRAC